MKALNKSKNLILFILSLCVALCAFLAFIPQLFSVNADANTTFKIIEGAEIRVSNDKIDDVNTSGIKFKASISASEFNTITNNGEKEYEFGMLIAGGNFTSTEQAISILKENEEKTKKQAAKFDEIYNPSNPDAEVYSYTVALYNITDFTKTYAVLGYITVGENENTYYSTVSKNGDNMRSIFQVATNYNTFCAGESSSVDTTFTNGIVDGVMSNAPTIEFDKSEYVGEVGDEISVVTTVGGQKIEPIYSVDNASVAKVENNKIVAVKGGTATITATIKGSTDYTKTVALKIVPILTDEQNVNYGYDADDDCYYVTYSPNVTATSITIPAKFNDEIHGEKDVKYVAMVKDANAGEKGAFQGNTYLQEVILPSTVVSINGSAFRQCTNLTYVEMPGVKQFQDNEANRNYATEQFTGTQVTTVGLNSMYGAFCGYNFISGATEIDIIVADGFKAGNTTKYNIANGQTLNVYSLGKTAMSETESQGTYNFYYYNESPTDANYMYWHYVNDVITIWPALDMTDEQGVNYGFDAGRGTYYVSKNTTYSSAIVRIPATFNDGVHGEKAVEYIGDEAFKDNSSITHVYLPVSVNVIGDRAFQSCYSLQYISMTGVRYIKYDYPGTGYAGISTTDVRYNQNTFQGCNSLTTVVVGESIDIDSPQFGVYNYNNANRPAAQMNVAQVYSLRTTPETWNSDRTTNLIIRSSDSNNNLFKDGIIYYSEQQPTDTNNTYWHYNNDGNVEVWVVA